MCHPYIEGATAHSDKQYMVLQTLKKLLWPKADYLESKHESTAM